MKLLRTPLFEEHAALGAKVTEFAGWEMPLEYRDIRAEHLAVRSAAGLFDLSHMGRLLLTGPGRAAFLDRLSANSVLDLAPGRARYTLFCDESGGAVDDLVLFAEHDRHWVVCNASNRAAVMKWMLDRAGREVTIHDATFELGMLALQGPAAAGLLASLGVRALDDLKYFRLRRDRVAGVDVLLSRTGYTGEDGFEIVASAGRLAGLWRAILDAGSPAGVIPAGLGARDTLRLEAGLCLYGHELTRSITPIEAGLSRFVKFEGREFIGKEKLLEASRRDDSQVLRLIGLTFTGHRIPRTGQEILHASAPVGRITSGTFSPTLEKPLALGYVPVTLSEAGTPLAVQVSHEVAEGTVTALPFYSRRK